MKKRKLAERIMALLLAFLLVIGEVAGTGLTVRAADPETSDEEDDGSGEYNPGGKPNMIWVKTSKGDKNLVTEGSVKEGDGELTYNSSTCTLTMKNFNITNCYVKSGTEAYGLYCDGRLNIVVEGDCKISATAPSNATVIDGIHVDQELTIKSGATAPLSSLTVSMGGSSKGTSTGIFGGYGITIGNGAAGTISVYATASNAAQDSYGVRAGRGITMASGTLKATGGKVTSNSRSSYGILSKDGTFSVSGTASITATGGSVGSSTAKSYGLYHAGDLKVSGGTLTLETASVSGDLYTESCALYITKSTTISGGTVNATAGTAGNKATSHGVNSTGKLTISGGTLKANSGKAGGTYSIAVDAGTFAMSGGTLNAAAGAADSESYGLRLTDKQERETKITKGTIVAKAGSAKTSYGIKVNTYFTLTGGKCTAVGNSEAISAAKPNSSTKEVTIKAPVYEGGAYTNGSSLTILDYYMYGWKYAILDATRAVVLIDDWTWGDPANSPSVMNPDRYGDGKVTASFAYKAKSAADSAYSSTIPSAVGDYTVKASLSNSLSATKDFKIKQRDLSSVTATIKSGAYSGNSQNAVFTLSYKDKTLKEGTDYKVTEGKSATDVGNVSAKLSGMGNFTGTKTVKWSLTKATPDASYYEIDGRALPVAIKRDYNGRAQSVNTPVLRTPYTGGGSVRILYEKDSKQSDQAPSEVGTYKLIMRVGAGSNFNAAADDINAGTLEIIKAANTMSVHDTKAMTGHTLDLTTAVSGAIGELSFTISGTTRGCSISGSTLTTGTETGEITISVTAAGNENYKESTKTFKVNIKEMKMETLDVTMPSVTYGDTLEGPKYDSRTGMSGLKIHYTGIDVYGTEYNDDEKPSNAGKYAVSVEYEAGETVYSGSAEFSIERKEITIVSVKAYDKTYNADINAELDWNSVVLNGVVDKDKTDLGCFVMGEFADPDVGNDKPITITDVALESGGQEISENYYIDETTWPVDIKGNILPLSVRVTALDQTVEAGKPVASMPDLVRMETVNAYEFIPSGHELSAITIQGDFDNYKTKADGAEIKDADGADVTSNYVFEYVDGNLTVTPRNLEAALVEVDGSYTFNGAEIEPAASAVTVTLDGDELLNGTDYSISSYSDNIHAGTAKVIITGKGAFTGEASGSFTIGAKELSEPEITVSTAIWDGSAQEPNVQVYDPDAGFVNPMEYNLLYSNNVKVGDKTATVTVTDREGGDYIISGSAAFSIKKAAMRTLETINRNISKDDKSPRVSIASMLPADAGAATGYDLWEEPIRNGVVLNDCLVNTKGEIELEIKSGVSSDWVMVSYWIKGENYDVTFWVRLTLTSLKTPEYTAPTAAALSYTGSAQKLLIPGTVTKGGKFEYSEDLNDWSEEIPEGTEAGEYTVYYRLTSTSEYNGVEATPVYVRIRNAAYRLTVENGEGSGDYEEGERVTISAAAAPAGQIFDKWTSEDTVVFEDDGASTTSLTMPGKAVTVSATYKKDEKP